MSNKQDLAWTGTKLIIVGLGAVLVASIAAPLFKLMGKSANSVAFQESPLTLTERALDVP